MTDLYLNGTGGLYLQHPAWNSWVAATTNITTTATTQVWDGWVGTTGTAATIYPAVWNEWNRTGYPAIPRGRSKPYTAEQLEQQARQRAIHWRRGEVAAMRKRVAQRRAEQLLLEHLDEKQRSEWAKGREFHVETADGKRTYRIREGVAGNVYLVRNADQPGMQRTRRYCCHVDTSQVPVLDNVLTQKLLIEANEGEFLRLANVA